MNRVRLPLVAVTCLALTTSTGCLRSVRECTSAADCFGNETCEDGACRVSSDSDAGGGTGTDAGEDAGEDTSCPDQEQRCGGSCVLIDGDARHCGACDNACDAGELCINGWCEEPAVCVSDADCEGLSWCGPERLCVAGCVRDEQCGERQCDFEVNTCSCGADELACDGQCVPCPDDDTITQVLCSVDGTTCEAAGCTPGYELCDTGCCPVGSASLVARDGDWSYASLVLDEFNRPHVAYQQRGDGSTNVVWYASWDGTAWNASEVYRGGRGEFVDLALDGSSQPHVIYQADDSAGVRMAHSSRASGEWRSQLAPASACEPEALTLGRGSILVDSIDRKHVMFVCGADEVSYWGFGDSGWSASGSKSYYSVGTDGIRVALNGEFVVGAAGYASDAAASSRIQIVVIDPERTENVFYDDFESELGSGDGFGSWLDLATDAFGGTHVVYQDEQSRLRHMVAPSFAFEPSTIVDDASTVGAYVDMEVDRSGIIHVVYVDEASGVMKYASGVSGAWEVESVGVPVETSWCSLELDDQDRPHVLYRQGRELRYAFKDGNRWRF